MSEMFPQPTIPTRIEINPSFPIFISAARRGYLSLFEQPPSNIARRRSAAHKRQPVAGFGRFQRMQDDRPTETGSFQEFQVVRIIQPTPSSRHMPGLSVLVEVFR